MKTTIHYSHFKPFSAFSIGGTVTEITRKAARQLIKRKKMKYIVEKHGQEKGVRRFQSGREIITFYI